MGRPDQKRNSDGTYTFDSRKQGLPVTGGRLNTGYEDDTDIPPEPLDRAGRLMVANETDPDRLAALMDAHRPDVDTALMRNPNMGDKDTFELIDRADREYSDLDKSRLRTALCDRRGMSGKVADRCYAFTKGEHVPKPTTKGPEAKELRRTPDACAAIMAGNPTTGDDLLAKLAEREDDGATASIVSRNPNARDVTLSLAVLNAGEADRDRRAHTIVDAANHPNAGPETRDEARRTGTEYSVVPPAVALEQAEREGVSVGVIEARAALNQPDGQWSTAAVTLCSNAKGDALKTLRNANDPRANMYLTDNQNVPADWGMAVARESRNDPSHDLAVPRVASRTDLKPDQYREISQWSTETNMRADTKRMMNMSLAWNRHAPADVRNAAKQRLGQR